MRKLITVALVSLALGAVGCGNGDDDGRGRAAEWGYSGSIGPDHWADLSPDYALCGDGTEQSPIDIGGGIVASAVPPLGIDYHATPLVIYNNGHTIEVEYEEGSTLTVGADVWELKQFHFHARSEHTVDGVAAPLEMHLVHQHATGGRAVVGLFILEGAANAALAAVFDHLPAEEGEPEEVEGVEVNAADVLPADLSAWRYNGSLTTPPCDEGVRWHILAAPIEASAEQIDAFEAIFDDNYRPVQPLNGREID